MIDNLLKNPLQKKVLDPLLKLHLFKRCSPNTFTFIGLMLGLLTLPSLWLNLKVIPIIFLLLSGLFDTLDGSLARSKQTSTELGAVYDITADRIVEIAIILGLYLVSPDLRGLGSLFMMSSVLFCVTTFLVVGIVSTNDSEKSFHYSPGIMERAEAFIFFILMIIFPSAFFVLALLFSFLVFLTGVLRIIQFRKTCVSRYKC